MFRSRLPVYLHIEKKCVKIHLETGASAVARAWRSSSSALPGPGVTPRLRQIQSIRLSIKSPIAGRLRYNHTNPVIVRCFVGGGRVLITVCAALTGDILLDGWKDRLHH